MQRKKRKIKPLIIIFNEGETEQVYAQLLAKHFSERAIIKIYPHTGIYPTPQAVFANEARFKNNIDATDEIWLFFDVEHEAKTDWKVLKKMLDKLSNLRKSKIVVRLLMTTACIEYWLLLHYENVAPLIATVGDKCKITNRLKQYIPNYQKGKLECLQKIFVQYQKAVLNGAIVFKSLESELVNRNISGNDGEINKYLYNCGLTFTTVHKAIEFLEKL